MINTVGTNTGNPYYFPTYTGSSSSTTGSSTNSAVNLLTDQYQQSSMDSLSSSWDLLTQSYSPQSVLNYYQQQQNNSSTKNESFQQQVMNEIQSNPGDVIQMSQDSSLNSLVQSEFSSSSLNQLQPDNMTMLAENYDAMNMSNNVNLNPTNIQMALTQIQNNPIDSVELQHQQEIIQFLQSQFGTLGNNLDISY